MKKIFLISSTLLTVLFFNSCKKEKDKIPTRDLSSGKIYSAAELKSIATSTNTHRINDDNSYFKGVVIADEVSGNFYKELYVRDAANTGAIHFLFPFGGSNLFIGDSVRLNLKGYDAEIDPTTKILTIDSVSFEKNLVKFASGANPQPIEVSLSAGNYANYYGDLIIIKNVGFSPIDTAKIYADPIQQISINREVSDCGGAKLIVRTSNYAQFALEKTPKGFGSITGIATSYNGADQMSIRTPKELYMNGVSPCLTYLKKDFVDASLTSGGWTQNAVVNGAILWSFSTAGGGDYAKISGFLSGNQNSENWLISPAVDLSASINPILNFRTAGKFPGNPLEVFISNNYTSGNPNAATWTALSGYTLGALLPGYQWANSGTLSLNAFKNANTRIAFKYTSNTSGATTWEVDDIIIREN
jgi:hypothetical protein